MCCRTSSIEVAKGEIVCLIGRNGAGKTTTLKSIMGLMDKTRGSAVFKGKELLGQPAHVRFALGLAYVPEERRIVQGLSVRENLRLGLVASPEKRREVELIEASRGYSRGSPSGWIRKPSPCPAASSRCWRSHAR